jgi:hypothetical protein
MPRKVVDFDTVREIAMALPDVEQSTSYGATSFKVRGKMFACPAINRSAEAGSLGVRIDFNLRAQLLASTPDVYYLTPHYENYPCVLVRLARINRTALKQLLGTAWFFVSSSAPKRRVKVLRKMSARKRR